MSSSGWMCLGYWDDDTTSYETACEQLALKLIHSTAVDLDRPLAVLDVGCGNGVSTMLYADRFPAMTLVGVDISPQQVKTAIEQLHAVGDQSLSSRVSFSVADAVDLSRFDSNSFDIVLALECAFHFEARATFFAEAIRVLRPAGKIALADICAQTKIPLKPAPALMKQLMLSIPDDNLENMTTYNSRMQATGFVNSVITPITADTFCPFSKFFDRAQHLHFKTGAQPNTALAAFSWYMCVSKFLMRHTAEYILAVGTKPSCD